MIGLPGADVDLAEIALDQTPASLARVKAPPAWIPGEDSRFTDAVRRALLEHPEGTEAMPESGPCPLDTPQFTTVLDHIEDALHFLDDDTATAWLAKVDVAFSCDQEPVHPAVIARYFFLSGVLEFYQLQDDNGRFERAAARAPGEARAADFALEIRDKLARAQERVSQRRRVRVTYEEDLAGLTLYVDGAPVRGNRGELLEGLHFLQLVDPSGRVVAASPVSIGDQTAERQEVADPAAAGAVPVAGGAVLAARDTLPPASLRPPSAAQVHQRLREAVGIGRLDPALARALQVLLRAGRHPWLLLVAPVSGLSPARALWVMPGGELESLALAPGASKAGIAGTVALAGVTAAAAGALAWYRWPVWTQTGLPAADQPRYLRNSIISGVVAGLGAAGTITLASYTWKKPAGWYRRGRLKVADRVAGFTARVSASGVAMELRWE